MGFITSKYHGIHDIGLPTCTGLEREWVLARTSSLRQLIRHQESGTRDHFSSQQAEAFLQSVPLMEGMDDESRRTLAARLEARCYRHGEAIVEEGEWADAMYIVESGRAIVLIHGRGARLHARCTLPVGLSGVWTRFCASGNLRYHKICM